VGCLFARRCRKAGVKMGMKYYAYQRTVFADDRCAFHRLKALDMTEPVEPLVEAVVKGVSAHPGNLGPMATLFATDLRLGQRNVVAVLRALVNLQLGSNLTRLSLVVEGMRWLKRNRLHTAYPEEVGICRHHFDEVLNRHRDLGTAAGRTTLEWWNLVRDVCGLAFDSEAFATCVEH